MRIGFYNPYFDGFGGGERYTLTLASYWSKRHEVELFWNNELFKEEAEKRFDLDLSNIKIVHNIFLSNNILQKLFLSKQYDLIFFLSDGSVPTSLAKFNILHFQVPFPKIEINPFKLSRFQSVVCNSLFTRSHLDIRLGEKAIVIYPPVQTKELKRGKKEKQILSVGRFSSHFQAKKQQVLIKTFRKGYETGIFTDWRLLLVGGLLPQDQNFFRELKQISFGLPIDFFPNISYAKLAKLYEESMVYWHAAGFGEVDPVLAEHFGISTVEAMAAGCIPLVYNGGGQPEIVTHKKNGYLWNTTDELIGYTTMVKSKRSFHAILQKEAIKRSKEFNEVKFTRAFDELLESITK